MSQTATPAVIGRVSDLLAGGLCAWRLPPDPICASVGRSLIRMTLHGLGEVGDQADAAALAVSELATNALHHGLHAGSHDSVVQPELWAWCRATPEPQLVVTVFDGRRDLWPDVAPHDLMDEHGRGVGIVDMVADAWGVHPSRSRLAAPQVPGKAVWAAFTLSGLRPDQRDVAPASTTARDLATAVAARGIPGVVCRHERTVSLVTVPLAARGQLNIWVEPGRLTFVDVDGTRVARAAVDLHDVTEHLLRRAEESRLDGG